MLNKIKRLLQSIALLPSGLALFFLLFAVVFSMVEIDYDNHVVLKYFSISDKSDTKTILSFVIGGIFTLTVFSYTMVMNVLQRNINNYSPRVVPLLLSQKSHQIILGFTSGTIIYSMVMSISLTNDESYYFPTLAGGLGVALAIVCILLFIHFLHTISRSVHINHILKDVYEMTVSNRKSVKDKVEDFEEDSNSSALSYEVRSKHCGYLRLPRYNKIDNILENNDLSLRLEHVAGDFVYEKDILYTLDKEVDDDIKEEIEKHFSLDNEVILSIPETGLKHLVEVIAKASSPAINDPGTSLAGIHYLTQSIMDHYEYSPKDSTSFYTNGRLSYKSYGTREMCIVCFAEVYHYCHRDPVLMATIQESLHKINTNCDFDTEITLEELQSDL